MSDFGPSNVSPIARNGVVYASVDVVLLPIDGGDGGDAVTSYDEASAGLTRGEVAVHSSRLIGGYFNDAERTAAAFVQVAGKRYGGVDV